MQQAITWDNPDLYGHVASLGHNELNFNMIFYHKRIPFTRFDSFTPFTDKSFAILHIFMVRRHLLYIKSNTKYIDIAY